MKFEKISYEELKNEEYKGIIFIQCKNCKNVHRIPKPKIADTWRKFCKCGKPIIGDYTILTSNVKIIKWNDYLFLKKVKEVARVYKPTNGPVVK